jgi:hypothetical protein
MRIKRLVVLALVLLLVGTQFGHVIRAQPGQREIYGENVEGQKEIVNLNSSLLCVIGQYLIQKLQ